MAIAGEESLHHPASQGKARRAPRRVRRVSRRRAAPKGFWQRRCLPRREFRPAPRLFLRKCSWVPLRRDVLPEPDRRSPIRHTRSFFRPRPVVAFTGGGTGAGASGRATGTGSDSRFATAGAISARSTSVPPHSGHSIKPRFACFSKLALSLNQPSNPCNWPHRNW